MVSMGRPGRALEQRWARGRERDSLVQGMGLWNAARNWRLRARWSLDLTGFLRVLYSYLCDNRPLKTPARLPWSQRWPFTGLGSPSPAATWSLWRRVSAANLGVSGLVPGRRVGSRGPASSSKKQLRVVHFRSVPCWRWGENCCVDLRWSFYTLFWARGGSTLSRLLCHKGTNWRMLLLPCSVCWLDQRREGKESQSERTSSDAYQGERVSGTGGGKW